MNWSGALAEVRTAILVGPTGVGKTAVALALASTWDLEVVSADSRQVYRGLDIATAKRLIEKYYGPVPPGPALDRPKEWIPSLATEKIVGISERSIVGYLILAELPYYIFLR